jgi:hypothetical protein
MYSNSTIRLLFHSLPRTVTRTYKLHHLLFTIIKAFKLTADNVACLFHNGHPWAPRAQIYYEVRGSSPCGLFIPCGNGFIFAYDRIVPWCSGFGWLLIADVAPHVCIHLTGAQDYSQRLGIDADEAQRPISDIPNTPVIVFGSSSAVLELLSCDRCALRTPIPYEAPVTTALP